MDREVTSPSLFLEGRVTECFVMADYVTCTPVRTFVTQWLSGCMCSAIIMDIVPPIVALVIFAGALVHM